MGVSYFITFTEKPGNTCFADMMEIDTTMVKTAKFTPRELGLATEVATRVKAMLPDIFGSIVELPGTPDRRSMAGPRQNPDGE